MRKLLSTFLLSLVFPIAHAQVQIDLVPVATGLDDIVDIVHAGDDRIFCVLQPGTIRIVQNGTLLPDTFLNITAQVNDNGWEQGLLGMAFDPEYSQNGFFYVHYTAFGGSGVTTISRFQVSATDPDMADPQSEQVLFTYQQPAGNHNGGDVEFGPDGYLYISLGDGGGAGDSQNNAQTLSNPLGALLRIDVSDPDTTYTIPPENPFANAAGDTLPEIFAYGLRNPWRIGFDAVTGDLWIGDVGQVSWEEVDLWPVGDAYNSGPNFGWRCREGFDAYNMTLCGPLELYLDPLIAHPNTPWCSIVGGRVYRGSAFPALYGRYIYTDHCEEQVRSLHPDGEGGWVSELLSSDHQSGLTCIGEDSSLELYAGNKNNGTLYRIEDALHVSITDPDQKENFRVYPVPADDDLVIVRRSDQGAATASLYDQAGRRVAQVSFNATQARMDVGHLANGMYVMRLEDPNGASIAHRQVTIAH